MIATIKIEDTWLKVYNPQGKQLSQMPSIKLTLLAVSAHFFVTKQGPWIVTYNQHCHQMGQMLPCTVKVRGASGHSFTTIEGQWMRMYDMRCIQINERRIGRLFFKLTMDS